MKTTDSGSDPQMKNSTQVANLHWCTCEKCVIAFSMALEESKCQLVF